MDICSLTDNPTNMNDDNNTIKCLVCFSYNSSNDSIITCNGCSLSVHLKCYGCISKTSVNNWKCRYCIKEDNKKNFIAPSSYKCRICNQKQFGALKPCAKRDGYAHLVCALWTSFIFVENEYHLSPIKNIDKCKLYKNILNKLKCNLCHKYHATIKCRIKKCKIYYHPLCLIQHNSNCMIKHNININSVKWNYQINSTEYYIYCDNHLYAHKLSEQGKDFIAGEKRKAIIIKNKQKISKKRRRRTFTCIDNNISYNNNNNNSNNIDNNMSVMSVDDNMIFNDNNSIQSFNDNNIFEMNNNLLFNDNNGYLDNNEYYLSQQQRAQSQPALSIANSPSAVSGISNRSRAPIPIHFPQHTQLTNDNTTSYI